MPVTHSKVVQDALNYIETNLSEELSLDEIANAVGFSKFYFNRTFQSDIGMPVYDYIRKRRLANAASLLLSTDVSIIDIALTSCFESQEAFTRAFKSVYQIPPGRYRAAIKNLICGGFPMDNSAKIKEWLFTGTAPGKFEAGIDNKIYNTGTKSATLKSIADNLEVDEYATIMQQFNAKNFLGKRARFSGFVKTLEVDGRCGLWMRIDNFLGATLKLDNMQNRAITGTTEWNHYSCVLDIPKTSGVISIGVLLNGTWQVWLDNVTFQEVDHSIPTTDFTPDDVFPDYPKNLSFEE
jgi:AraC-like DNA-binding protein